MSRESRNRSSYQAISASDDEEVATKSIDNVVRISPQSGHKTASPAQLNLGRFLGIISLALVVGLGVVAVHMKNQIVQLQYELAQDEADVERLRSKVQNQDVVIQRFNGR
jgi:uncharacterized protein HemX